MLIVILILALIGILFFLGFLTLVGFAFWFLPVLLVGLIAGAIAGSITESKHGLLGDMVIGLVGSVIGGALLGILFHHRPAGLVSLEGIVAAIVGSVILLAVLKALR